MADANKGYQDPNVLERLYWGEEMTCDDIGEQFGVTGSTVRDWMIRHDIERRDSHEMNTKDYKRASELRDEEWLREQYYTENKSLREIASELDVSRNTVLNWIKRHGIEPKGAWQSRCKYPELLDKEWLQTEYIDKGRSQTEIGDELGCHAVVVSNAMKQHGIDARDGPNKGGEETVSKGPNWEEQRQKRLELDDYECQDCGSATTSDGRSLHVHHIKERSEFKDGNGDIDWDTANNIDNLLTLCDECHLRRHSK